MQTLAHEINSIPAEAGIGLRAQHYQEIITHQPKVAWFEVHSENYFGKGGKPHYYLELIRNNYPLSFHGVGLSLGSADELNQQHLSQIKNLIDRYAPTFVSEHLSWSAVDGNHLNDLLPLPYTQEALDILVQRIKQTQDCLQRQILIENISSYLQFSHSIIPEEEFITSVVKQSGCGILLDINNLYVNSVNHGWDAKNYLQHIPSSYVQEIHLAGFTENHFEQGSILIDTHNQLIADKVWELYAYAIENLGRKPSLIEWDKDIPEFSVLMSEANKANCILEQIDVVVT